MWSLQCEVPRNVESAGHAECNNVGCGGGENGLLCRRAAARRRHQGRERLRVPQQAADAGCRAQQSHRSALQSHSDHSLPPTF